MPQSSGLVLAVVPARFGAQRFPGKPLVDLRGRPMVVRVADAARRARTIDRVLIATDDDRIAEACRAAGHAVVMTPASCPSGTDRVYAALLAEQLLAQTELVVNVQGDEPLLDPDDVDVLVEETRESGLPMGTIARPLSDAARLDDPNVVKVVIRADGRALYFSRATIPHGAAPGLALQHVGLYCYRPEALRTLTALPPSPLERAERLEQLRALEHGLDIHVALARSPRASIAIDTPEDVTRVLAILDDPLDPRSTHATR
jgi:3-deoxy-manno-octulosonate cytidylyltransferase (CMP-KDO synthetase)